MMVETETTVCVRTFDVLVAPAPIRTTDPIARRTRGLRVLAVFVAGLFAFNFALAMLLEKGPAHWRDPEYGFHLRALQQKRRQFPDRKLTVILGSSRTAMGVRPDVYEASLGDPLEAPLLFNMSLAGAGPILQLMTLERMLTDGIIPDAILLEYWPPLLRGDGPYREDRRIGAPRLRESDEPIVDDYFADPEDVRSKMRWGRTIPAWYHRRAFLDQLWPESVPRTERTDAAWAPLDGWGWLPGRKSYTTDQVEKGWPQVAGFYAPLFQGFAVAPVADRALRTLLARCRMLGIDVSLLALPESNRFRTMMTPESIRIGVDFRRGLQREFGVPLIDGTPWAEDASLPDGYHLTQDGATRFTRELSGHIAPCR